MFESIMNRFVRKRVQYDFYVGGPMRGYPDLNKKMFALVSRLLRSKKFTVWSPSEHESYLRSSFAECMTEDFNAVINKCNKIALLPGWRNSLGANMEVFVALGTGKEAVEVVLNEDGTDFDLAPFDLSMYRLPYDDGETKSFNPHKCDLDSFTEKK